MDTLSKPEEYVRSVVVNFYGSGLDKDRAVVRIGIAGRGIAPHYKIEYPEQFTIGGDDTPLEFQATFQIYQGRSHKRMTAFEIDDVRDEHWSTKTMTYDEVAQLLGKIRTKRKG